MTIEQFRLISSLQTALALIGTLMAFWHFRSRSVLIRLVGLSFFIGVLGNVLGHIFFLLKMRNFINPPQSLYFILVFCFITLIYYHALNKTGKHLFIFIVTVFLLFSFGNLVFFQRDTINSYNNVLSAALVIGYAIYYFYRLIVDMPATHLHRLPMFWFNAGFLVYHAGAFFLFVFTDYLVNVMGNNLLYYWTFHNILSILGHLIIITGLWIDLKTIKSRSS